MSRRITGNALESRPVATWRDGDRVLEFRQRGGRIHVSAVPASAPELRPVDIADFTTAEIQLSGYVLTAAKLRGAAARWINDNLLAN
ncbi:hypothetical protein SEA_BOLT007_74 [Arthrobacter phage Bolt007]|uniref:Uncharacterized protein n=1 Tax=Arthrobacter phage Bolt007 TaxID=3017297 RepID=A0AA49E4E6_9CAUD|nr:hypothetical protein SEA_BOLT007_74 [Arthrobacter phage Bolt007]